MDSKFVETIPIFDTSGETMCNITTTRDNSRFLNFPIFSVPKITPRNTLETWKPIFFYSVSRTVAKKNQTWPAIAEVINYVFLKKLGWNESKFSFIRTSSRFQCIG